MTDWALPYVPRFEWEADPEPMSREDWVKTDGGFWVYPPAGNDREPVWISDQEADAFTRDFILGTLAAIANVLGPVGTIKGLIEFFYGRDIITGEKLSWLERAIGVSGLLGEGIGSIRNAAGEIILKRTEAVLSAADLADQILDYQALLESQTGPLMAEAAEQLRQGADVNTLEWRQETTALLQVGILEARRLTDQIAERYPMTPEQAEATREVLLKAFVRQAQADGLLPERLQVMPSAAEGGDPSETIDVWDPMTGTAWDVTGAEGAASDRVGTTVSNDTASATITQVETVLPPRAANP